MSSEWKEYKQDPRIICKYGAKCYQQNTDHHQTYKHPPQLKAKNKDDKKNKRFQPYNKKNTDVKVIANCSTLQEDKSDEIVPGAMTVNTATQIDLMSIIELDNLTYYSKEFDNNIYKECFQVEMPDDFFKFFECLNEESSSVEHLMASVNLEMIGPFDLLLGKLPKLEDKDLYLVHWRFFYDVPEYQAILKKKGKSELHIGYYRDNPKEKPTFLAKNDSAKDYMITPVSDNIFGAVYWFLQNEKSSSPFMSIACQKLSEKVKKWAESNGYSIEEFDKRTRIKNMTCKTFHGAGIVVPYNKKTQLGYRKLVETDANIKKMFKKLEEVTEDVAKNKILSEIQPLITYSSIAIDECDFGTGLEAGVALFCSGLKELQSSALSLLTSSYSLLKREEFAKIIQVHMKYRRKGPYMALWGDKM
ncbi:histone PARylation factor 1 [Pieris napi]|uniref:histone PARylation factor 1 n=1 Tax=Pieris napi TaxID=78633 RepID=UPI001FB9771A|nr:histone PARylation factor 1 [Pieris napi]